MPASYQPHTRGDDDHEKTHSQSIETNLSAAEATVGHVMEKKGRDVHTIGPDETIGHAVEVLRDKRIGAVLVTDAAGHLVGILSERDIVRRLADTPGRTLPQTVAELAHIRVVAHHDLALLPKDVVRNDPDAQRGPPHVPWSARNLIVGVK